MLQRRILSQPCSNHLHHVAVRHGFSIVRNHVSLAIEKTLIPIAETVTLQRPTIALLEDFPGQSHIQRHQRPAEQGLESAVAWYKVVAQRSRIVRTTGNDAQVL